VSLDPLPTDELQDVTACLDPPPQLDAGNLGSTYDWSTAETTRSITPLASGTYSVTVTTAANCSATFDVQVDLMPLVSVSLGADTALCTGQALVLDPGSVTGSIAWSTGATTPTLTVDGSGTYALEATNGFCSDADTIVVVFQPLPVDPLTDQTSCIGTPLQLDAANTGSSYAWSNGASSQSITVDQTGTYSVTVTTADGCSADFSATASFVDPPEFDLGRDTVLCAGEILDLNAEVPGCTYLWGNGSVAPQQQVSQPGLYSVSVANGYCTASDSVHVLFDPVPSHIATHRYFACLDDDPHYVSVDAGNPGGTYQWSNGQVAQVAQVFDYGIITVNITNAFGCSLLDSATVVESCQPTIFVPNTFTPNGDGHNDVWLAVGNNVVFYEVFVFDRWGGVIFHSVNMDEGWDGTINGDPAPNDVYVWKATYQLQDPDSSKAQFEQTMMGRVQVLR
jgi:gliding motility-associated-like protein